MPGKQKGTQTITKTFQDTGTQCSLITTENTNTSLDLEAENISEVGEKSCDSSDDDYFPSQSSCNATSVASDDLSDKSFSVESDLEEEELRGHKEPKNLQLHYFQGPEAQTYMVECLSLFGIHL